MKKILRRLADNAMRITALITAMAFLSFELVWASGYSDLLDNMRQKKKSQLDNIAVSYKGMMTPGMAQSGGFTQVTDNEKQQVYFLDTHKELAKIVDLRSGLTAVFRKSAQNPEKVVVSVVDTDDSIIASGTIESIDLEKVFNANRGRAAAAQSNIDGAKVAESGGDFDVKKANAAQMDGASPDNVVEYVRSWLDKNASFLNIPLQAVQKIVSYLSDNKDKIFNCAIEAISNVFELGSIFFNKEEVAATAILLDIMTGTFDIGGPAEDMQLSMYSMLKTAELYGIRMTGYDTDISGLSAAVSAGKSAVAHLDLGQGQSHFVVVNSVQNGIVSYTDSDKKNYSVSQQEFAVLWTGKILSQKKITGEAAAKLNTNQLQEFKGSALNIQAILAAAKAAQAQPATPAAKVGAMWALASSQGQAAIAAIKSGQTTSAPTGVQSLIQKITAAGGTQNQPQPAATPAAPAATPAPAANPSYTAIQDPNHPAAPTPAPAVVTPRINTEEVVKATQEQLNTFIAADATKKAEMAATLGLSLKQVTNISVQLANTIINNVRNNVAVWAPAVDKMDAAIGGFLNLLGVNVTTPGAGTPQAVGLVPEILLSGILTGTITQESIDTRTASTEYVQNKYGLEISFGNKEDLSQVVDRRSAAVTLDDEQVIVTGLNDDNITYLTSDGAKHTISENEFLGKWDGMIVADSGFVQGTIELNGEILAYSGSVLSTIHGSNGEVMGTCYGGKIFDGSGERIGTYGDGRIIINDIEGMFTAHGSQTTAITGFVDNKEVNAVTVLRDSAGEISSYAYYDTAGNLMTVTRDPADSTSYSVNTHFANGLKMSVTTRGSGTDTVTTIANGEEMNDNGEIVKYRNYSETISGKNNSLKNGTVIIAGNEVEYKNYSLISQHRHDEQFNQEVLFKETVSGAVVINGITVNCDGVKNYTYETHSQSETTSQTAVCNGTFVENHVLFVRSEKREETVLTNEGKLASVTITGGETELAPGGEEIARKYVNYSLKYRYDSKGNATRISYAGKVTENGAVTLYDYHEDFAYDDGKLVSSLKNGTITGKDVIVFNNNSTNYKYDSSGRVEQLIYTGMVTKNGEVIDNSYDEKRDYYNNGSLRSTVLNGSITGKNITTYDDYASQYYYNAMGNVSRIRYTGSVSVNGDVSITNYNEIRTYYENSGSIRAIVLNGTVKGAKTVEYNNSSTMMEYDAAGRVAKRTYTGSIMENGVLTANNYDEQYRYNANGGLEKTVRAGSINTMDTTAGTVASRRFNNYTITQSYDADGRVSGKVYSGSITQNNDTVTQSYHEAFTYDADGRLISETTNGAITSSADEAGNIVYGNYAKNYTYNNNGSLQNTSFSGIITEGAVQKLHAYNENYSYDESGRLTATVTNGNITTPDAENGNVVKQYDQFATGYTYNEKGMVTRKTFSGAVTENGSRMAYAYHEDISYDDWGRVLSVNDNGQVSAVSADKTVLTQYDDYKTVYSYGQDGNMLDKSLTGKITEGNEVTEYNEYTEHYAYDAGGNHVSTQYSGTVTKDADGSRSTSIYDYTITFTYNDAGELAGKAYSGKLTENGVETEYIGYSERYVSQPAQNTKSIIYNGTTITRPGDGSETTKAYAEYYITSVFDGEGKLVEKRYAGRLTENGNLTINNYAERHQYYADGKLMSVTTNGTVTDGQGMVTQYNAYRERYVYNAEGGHLSTQYTGTITNEGGVRKDYTTYDYTITSTYNDAGELTAKAYSGKITENGDEMEYIGYSERYVSNAARNTKTVISNGATIKRFYDGRETTRVYRDYSIESVFDSTGKLIEKRYTGQVTENGEVHVNAYIEANSYYSDGKLMSVVTNGTISDENGAVIIQFRNQAAKNVYNSDGNISSVEYSGSVTENGIRTTNNYTDVYSYNAHKQVYDIVRNGAVNLLDIDKDKTSRTTYQNYITRHAYDAFGNVVSKTYAGTVIEIGYDGKQTKILYDYNEAFQYNKDNGTMNPSVLNGTITRITDGASITTKYQNSSTKTVYFADGTVRRTVENGIVTEIDNNTHQETVRNYNNYRNDYTYDDDKVLLSKTTNGTITVNNTDTVVYRDSKAVYEYNGDVISRVTYTGQVTTNGKTTVNNYYEDYVYVDGKQKSVALTGTITENDKTLRYDHYATVYSYDSDGKIKNVVYTGSIWKDGKEYKSSDIQGVINDVEGKLSDYLAGNKGITTTLGISEETLVSISADTIGNVINFLGSMSGINLIIDAIDKFWSLLGLFSETLDFGGDSDAITRKAVRATSMAVVTDVVTGRFNLANGGPASLSMFSMQIVGKYYGVSAQSTTRVLTLANAGLKTSEAATVAAWMNAADRGNATADLRLRTYIGSQSNLAVLKFISTNADNSKSYFVAVNAKLLVIAGYNSDNATYFANMLANYSLSAANRSALDAVLNSPYTSTEVLTVFKTARDKRTAVLATDIVSLRAAGMSNAGAASLANTLYTAKYWDKPNTYSAYVASLVPEYEDSWATWRVKNRMYSSGELLRESEYNAQKQVYDRAISTLSNMVMDANTNKDVLAVIARSGDGKSAFFAGLEVGLRNGGMSAGMALKIAQDMYVLKTQTYHPRTYEIQVEAGGDAYSGYQYGRATVVDYTDKQYYDECKRYEAAYREIESLIYNPGTNVKILEALGKAYKKEMGITTGSVDLQKLPMLT
ncbi:MAG: hypothetical protein A2314_08630 [Elusimicrobia bacterium RIFOXYB2_FULL_50_12]|nr:MAG: hypothetical protein A2314_08630 [Elusimicrobia bacterium RIFOXYB2_FULL_50_12]